MTNGKIIIGITGIIFWGVLLGCATTILDDTIKGDVDKVASLLAEKPELINEKNKEEETPLHIAAKEGNQEIAELLIDKGADVNARDIKGKTPLHDAAFWCHKDAGIASISPYDDGEAKEIAKLLITKGADVNARDIKGKTPLHDAAYWCYAYETSLPSTGDFYVTYIHLWTCADENYKNKIITTSQDDQVSLESHDHWSYKGCGEIAEFLIAKGADVETKDINGKTPLHDASFWGNIETTELLIANGADVNAKDKRGGTPLDLAVMGRSKDVAKILIAKGADVGHTSLFEAADSGIIEIVEFLIAKGADVNDRNINSETPLHNAAFQGFMDIVELLIAKGADINAKSKWGYTPLNLADMEGHKKISKLLFKHGGK